jgi:hypothetical protein
MQYGKGAQSAFSFFESLVNRTPISRQKLVSHPSAFRKKS